MAALTVAGDGRVVAQPAHAVEDPVLKLLDHLRLRHAVDVARAVLEAIDVGRAACRVDPAGAAGGEVIDADPDQDLKQRCVLSKT